MSNRASWQEVVARGACWDREDARAALAAWRASGETQAAFSRRHGLGHRLGWWKRELERRPAEGSESLAPLVPMAVTTMSAAFAVVVTVAEVRVELAEATSASAVWVSELVCALREGQR